MKPELVYHWKFWKPVQCATGKVYFGYYIKMIYEGKPLFIKTGWLWNHFDR